MKLQMAVVTLGVAMFATVGVQAQTSTWTIDAAHSSVNFTIRHAAVSTVHGSLGGIKGAVVLDDKDLSKSSVEATIDATSVSTGVDPRDKHLKSPDFFDVAQFPTLTFKSFKIVNEGGKLQMIGDLTLHGVSKSVTLDLDGPAAPQKGPGGKIVSGFSATGLIKRSDFGFGPKFAPPALGDDVKFTIDIEMDKQ